MKTRKFGNTNLEVSEICFGPMRFSAKESGSDEKSKAGKQALERALERGLNFIHSSYEYGTRWAVGDVLKNHPKRHELHHIIKVPVPDFDDNKKFNPSKFRLRVEEALRDLHTDRIDILQHLQRAKPNLDHVRIPSIPLVQEPMLETFGKLKEEGKVGHLTTFPYTPSFGRKALETGSFSGLVAYYNLIEMEMAEFFSDLESKNQGFLCIRPFMGGLITDNRVFRNRLPNGDRYRDIKWATAYERLDILKSHFGDAIESWTQFAIKFCLCHPIVTSLIVGLNSTQQVDRVFDAADGDYPPQRVFESAMEIFHNQGPIII